MTKGTVVKKQRRGGDSSNPQSTNAEPPPVRRSCPSATPQRYQSPTPKRPLTLSTQRGARPLTSTCPATTTDTNQPCDPTVSSLSSSLALVQRSTDAAGHTRTLTYATSMNSSRSSDHVDDDGTDSRGCAVRNGSDRAHVEAEKRTASFFPLSETLAPYPNEKQSVRKEEKVRNSNAQRVSCVRHNAGIVAPSQLVEQQSAVSTRETSAASCEPRSTDEPANSTHVGVTHASKRKQENLSPQLVTPPTVSPSSTLHNFTSSPQASQAVGSALVKEGSKFATISVQQQQQELPMPPPRKPTRTHSLTSRVAHALPKSPALSSQRSSTPLPSTSTTDLASVGLTVDFKHPAVTHSCSLTRLMQRQQQEGWRDELRSALRQDADEWVRQVSEEQHLLEAQLSFTQAKVAELTREVQRLKGENAEMSAADRAQADSQADNRLHVTKKGKRTSQEEGSSEEDGSAGEVEESSKGSGIESVATAAYVLELETYIHSLESHSRAMHDAQQELQTRLDRRSSQLAAAHRRYEQNYALLLHEQAVLEADYQKATEDVEEVVGMLVVARAAEQAALRRLDEYEIALEEAEARMAAMTTAAAASPSSPPPLLSLWQEEGDAAVADHSPLQAETPESATTALRNPSTSGSVFYSCVDANDATLSNASSPPMFSAGRADVASTSSRPAVEDPLLVPFSHGRRTPLLSPPVGFPLNKTPKRRRASVDSRRAGAATPSTPLLIGSTGGGGDGAPPPASNLSMSLSLADQGTEALHNPTAFTAKRSAVAARSDPSPPLQAVEALSMPKLDLEGAVGGAEDAANLSHNPAPSGNRLLTPLVSSFAALLTPRTAAARRNTIPQPASPLLADGSVSNSGNPKCHSNINNSSCGGGAGSCSVSVSKDRRASPDERELLRFKCTLLELELQAKEKLHKEERDRWESAVCNAEKMRGAMGEIEARVRQATASSNKVKGLLHEMNRLWCNSLALEDRFDSEDDEGGDAATSEEARMRASCALMDAPPSQRLSLLRRYSMETPALTSQSRQSSVEGGLRSDGRPSSGVPGAGREFFGIESRVVF